jgi:phospholipase A1
MNAIHLRTSLAAGLLLAPGLFAPPSANAQAVERPRSPLADAQLTWQQCAALGNSNEARLACFDRWAQQQTLPSGSVPAAPPVLASTQPAPPVDGSMPATRVVSVATSEGCRDRQYSALSRFWELENGTDCGTFTFRGYRPLNVSASAATSKPETPTSPSEGHTASPVAYQANEMRIGLSVRTKIAQGLLTQNDPIKKDSLWFAYSQQSTWQLFNGSISRPFRTTDHEPELMYVYPLDFKLPGDWRWRYAGVGLVHQSNGQSLPLSRSWNRVYLMGGAELDDRFSITGRIWQRMSESTAKDDNPDISTTSAVPKSRAAGTSTATTAWASRCATTCATAAAARSGSNGSRPSAIPPRATCASTRSCSTATATRSWTTTGSARC